MLPDTFQASMGCEAADIDLVVIGEKTPARRQPLLMSIGAIEIEIAVTQNVTITDDTLCVERWRKAGPAKNGSKINPSCFPFSGARYWEPFFIS